MLLPLHDENPLKFIRFQYINIVLITVCILIFFYQMSLGAQKEQNFLYTFGSIPAVLFGEISLPVNLLQIPTWLTLVTSMFLHGSILHLGGNMLFLWVLGDNIEDAMGHKRFIVFYFLVGIVAAFSHIN